MQNKESFVNYESELMLFYNKYLYLGLGEGYLSELINRCATLWLNKRIPSTDKLNINSIKEFRINEDDYASLSKLDQDFINFYYRTYMRIDDTYGVILNSFGIIEDFLFDKQLDIVEEEVLRKNIGSDIFTFLSKLSSSLTQLDKKEEAQNYILQNIFSSKIYKAIFDSIMKKNGTTLSSLFALANRDIMEYEDKLKEKIDYQTILLKNEPYLRSRR